MALSGGNIYGAILLPSLIQVTKSISGSVVPLAMFQEFWLFVFCNKLNQSPAVEVYEGGDGDEPVEDDLVPVVAPHQIHLLISHIFQRITNQAQYEGAERSRPQGGGEEQQFQISMRIKNPVSCSVQ